MKLNKRNRKNLHAQGVLEYVLLIGIVVIALLAMTQAIKRGAQSLIKEGADQLAVQQNGEQSFSNTTGYLDVQNAISSEDKQKQVVERVGIINYIQDDASYSLMNSITNSGFTREQ